MVFVKESGDKMVNHAGPEGGQLEGEIGTVLARASSVQGSDKAPVLSSFVCCFDRDDDGDVQITQNLSLFSLNDESWPESPFEEGDKYALTLRSPVQFRPGFEITWQASNSPALAAGAGVSVLQEEALVDNPNNQARTRLGINNVPVELFEEVMKGASGLDVAEELAHGGLP